MHFFKIYIYEFRSILCATWFEIHFGVDHEFLSKKLTKLELMKCLSANQTQAIYAAQANCTEVLTKAILEGVKTKVVLEGCVSWPLGYYSQLTQPSRTTLVLTPKSIVYSSVFLLLCQSNVVYTIVNWQLFSVLPKWKKGQACFYGALNI